MHRLSISTAWDQAKAILTRDGRLFASAALALVALPSVITGLLSPGSMAARPTPLWADVVIVLVSLIALAGQLALIRLALGPSITVGGAITHGVARMPVYLLSAILLAVAFVVLAIPFVIVLTAIGVPLESTPIPVSPGLLIAGLVYLAVLVFVAVRMMMAAPVASAEPAGPLTILKRSWALTAAHWWQLFGFLLIFFVGAIAILIAAGSAVGVVVTILFGPPDPLSASALIVALVQALINAVLTTLFAVMVARIYAQLAGIGANQAGVPSSGT